MSYHHFKDDSGKIAALLFYRNCIGLKHRYNTLSSHVKVVLICGLIKFKENLNIILRIYKKQAVHELLTAKFVNTIWQRCGAVLCSHYISYTHD